MSAYSMERRLRAKSCKHHTSPNPERLAPWIFCAKCAVVGALEMSMKARGEMATQMAPRAMARAELLASAIGPAVSGLIRTRAQLAQRMAGRAWSRLLSERLQEDRVRQGPLASHLSQTHGARSDCMPLNEETQLWTPGRCLCRRKLPRLS